MFTKIALRILLASILALTFGGVASASQPREVESPRPGARSSLPAELRLQTEAPATQPAAPTAPQDVFAWSKLTFQAVRGTPQQYDVYTANGNGTGQVNVTNNAAYDEWPSFNRGATQIAFTSDRSGNYEIYTMNANGSGVTRRTTNTQDDYDPDWSPDGSKIAFTSVRDGNLEIYVMNANGSGQTRLTNSPGVDDQPAWSPDGSKIAFTSYRNGEWRIWVMNANGTNQVQLSSQPYSEEPAWSPDGTQIAFDADADGEYIASANIWVQDLWVMNADGSNQHLLLDPTQSYISAMARSWSPDGRYIGWTLLGWVFQNNQWYWYANLYDYDMTNGNTNVLSNYGGDLFPDWETTDTLAPTSSVSALPGTSPGPFTVSWTGSDNGPAGLRSYDTQVRDGLAGTWEPWISGTTANSALYYGVGGHTYYFRSRAWDNSYNVEAFPANPDAFTTVEALPPASAVGPLARYSNQTSFTVNWSGFDTGGSGIQSYDIQVQDGPYGTWTDWMPGTTSTSAQFNGLTLHTYSFRSRARDNAGNLEAYPADPDTITTLDTFAPSTAVNPLPAFSHSPVTVSWSGLDGGESGIVGYAVQYRDGPGGSWTYWFNTTTSTAEPFTGLPGHTYYFRSMGLDQALNLEDPPPGDGDAWTTIYTWGIRGTVSDNSGTPVGGAATTVLPAGAGAPSLATGEYAAYSLAASSAYTATWAKEGYGALPLTRFAPSPDAQFEVVLPPADNLVKNWGFESGSFGAWQVGGIFTPVVTDTLRHTGQYAAVLGERTVQGNAPWQAGNSRLSQAITLPLTTPSPVLSFLYQLHQQIPAAQNRFEVRVSQGITETTLFSTTASTPGWTHRWLDLGDWAGKTITLTFNVFETELQPPGWVALDEVSIGAAHPDLWVKKSASAQAVLPGQTVHFTLHFGNRGEALATGVRITDTLPAGMTFVDASLPPVITSPGLVWDIGSLAGGAGPFTIAVTAMLDLAAPPLSRLANQVEIEGQGAELEKLNNQAEVEVMVGNLVWLPVVARR